MYCPAEQDVTAVASVVSAVALHARTTYCVALGAVQAVHEVAEALLKFRPAEHATLPPAVPTALPPAQA